MTLSEIRIKSVDHKSPFLYPSRTLELKFSKGNVITPSRAATLYEYNQKGRVPTAITLNNTVSYSIQNLNLPKLQSFLLSNGAYHRHHMRISDADYRMKYSAFHFHIIQPTQSPIEDEETGEMTDSAIDYLISNPDKRETFLRLITQLQINLGLDVITLPYLRLATSEYSKLVNAFANSIRSTGREPMIVFDLDYGENADKFESAMDSILDQADIRLVALRYKSYLRHAISYDKLSKYAEREVAFVAFDMARLDKKNLEISTMHYMPFLGNDIYGVLAPRFIPPKSGQEGVKGYGKAKEPPKEISPKERIKFFNPSSLLVEPSRVRLSDSDKVLEEIDLRNDSYLKEVLGDYDVMDGDQPKLDVLSAFSKVHELRTSTAEFNNMQKWINSGESKEYTMEKQNLQSSLDSLKKNRKH